MKTRHSMSSRAMACALAGALAAGVPLVAAAQSCPPGYYYASDGNCYRGPPPSAPPPAYVATPPANPPPVVSDGLLIGLGVLLGGLLSHDHEEHRGHVEGRRAPRRYAVPERRREFERGRRRHYERERRRHYERERR